MEKQLLNLILFVVVLLLGASVSIFAQGETRKSVKTQTGVGKPYGARDPETC